MRKSNLIKTLLHAGVLKHYWKFRKQFTLLFGCLMISLCINIYYPIVIEKIIQAVADHQVMGKIYELILYGIVITLSKLGVQHYMEVTTKYVSEHLALSNRQGLMDHTLSLPMVYFESLNSNTDILPKAFADIGQIQETFGTGLLYFLKDALMILGISIIFIFISWKLFVLCAMAILGAYISTINFSWIAYKLTCQIRAALGKHYEQFSNVINHIADIKSSHLERWFGSKFQHDAEEYLQLVARKARICSLNTQILEALVLLLFVSFCAIVMASPELTNSMIRVVIYLAILGSSLVALNNFIIKAKSSLVSIEKINNLYSYPPSEKAMLELAESPALGCWDLRFDDVSFKYPRQTHSVISKCILSIREGSHVMLCGKNGIGKSTVAKLITRYYSPLEGKITVGGIDISKVHLGYWRKQVCLLGQNASLFNTSILDNIRLFSNKVSLEQVREVAALIGVDSNIQKLPMGYFSKVGDFGVNMSGGERQMILVLRALMSFPKILILDEATSELDSRIEERVVEKLLDLRRGYTTILIAHHRMPGFCGELMTLLHQSIRFTNMHAEHFTVGIPEENGSQDIWKEFVNLRAKKL